MNFGVTFHKMMDDIPVSLSNVKFYVADFVIRYAVKKNQLIYLQRVSALHLKFGIRIWLKKSSFLQLGAGMLRY